MICYHNFCHIWLQLIAYNITNHLIYITINECIKEQCLNILYSIRELNVTIPQSTLNNGTLYAHIFVGPQDKSPEKISNHDKFTIITAPLTKYLIPSAAEFNLVTGEYEVQYYYVICNTSLSTLQKKRCG